MAPIQPLQLASGVDVAGVRIVEPTPLAADAPQMNDLIRGHVVNLTPAGLELRRIVQATPQPEYVAGLRDWVAGVLAGTVSGRASAIPIIFAETLIAR